MVGLGVAIGTTQTAARRNRASEPRRSGRAAPLLCHASVALVVLVVETRLGSAADHSVALVYGSRAMNRARLIARAMFR